MVKIRLRRMGAKKAPFYRVVIADSRNPRDGKCIEEIGIYDPMTEPATVKIDMERAKYWIANGAQPTDTVKALLKKSVRTIYNTHMHKLGDNIEELNNGISNVKASSLIVRSDEGNRSFRIEVAPPEGMSYARDIAEKYGVTYEMLTDGMTNSSAINSLWHV